MPVGPVAVTTRVTAEQHSTAPPRPVSSGRSAHSGWTLSRPFDDAERYAERVARAVTTRTQAVDPAIALRSCDRQIPQVGMGIVQRCNDIPSASCPCHGDASIEEVLRSPGRELPAATRTSMEARLGHRFGNVRVHADAGAAASARRLQARAYTAGHHVVFAAGQYAPTSDSGQRLLAHELVHVVQQDRDTSPPLGLKPVQRQVAPGSTATAPVGSAPQCGPDVTDWFVARVNAAMSDPAVLGIRDNLTEADRLARLVGASGASFQEAGAGAAVLAQYGRLIAAPRLVAPVLEPRPPAPPMDPTISGQLSSAASTALPAARAAAGGGVATLPLPGAPVAAAAITAIAGAAGGLVLRAALDWKALVNHGAKYDFKRHVMFRPRAGGCPEPGCPPGEVGSVTICPGPGGNCFQSDRPGNIFYGAIGGYAGFSENTLQLGSQLAELTDLPRPGRPVITWDTPDDTAAINLGYRLRLPLTAAGFCGSVAAARSRLGARLHCRECTVRFPP